MKYFMKARLKEIYRPHPQLGKPIIPAGTVVDIVDYSQVTDDGYICIRYRGCHYMVKAEWLQEVKEDGS